MSPLPDPKSFFSLDFEPLPEARTTFESILSDVRVALEVQHKEQQEIARTSRKELESLVNRARPITKEFIKENAWRCNYVFPEGNTCNTVNGAMQQTKVIRKTCSKCARPRKNPYTVLQELDRDILIDNIIKLHKCSYSEALIKLDEANNGI